MTRPRLRDWLANSPRPTPLESRERAFLHQTLQNNSPGQWSQNVNELSRHFTGAPFLAINTLAKHAMDSTFGVFERVEGSEAAQGEVQMPWHDPIHSLFEQPNASDSFGDLMYQTTQQLAMTGMALEWGVPSESDDEPREIYNLPTANCWPMPPGPRYPFGAYRVLPYPYGMAVAPAGMVSSGAVIPAEQIVRIKNHHPYLRYDGYAVMTAISQQIDTLEAIDQSRNSTMQQGAEQTMALEPVAGANGYVDLSPEDVGRYRDLLRMVYAGPKNANKIFIPFGGYKLSQISTTPKDMAWQEGWSQVLDFCLAAFGVPKSVAGLQESANYATLYASLRAFCLFGLGPIVRQIARAFNRQVVWPTWGREMLLKINAPEFKDEMLEEQRLSNDLKAGTLLNREVRKMRGYDQLGEPWQKERAYANYSPQAEQGGDNPEAGTPHQPESSGERLEDPHVANSKPNGKALTRYQRAEILAKAFEAAKTNGHAHKIDN